MKNFHIRTINQQELQTALDWAEQEGWRPGLDDAGHYHPVDPEGFFMGFLDGKPIGCISGVAYDDSFGFIGLYIVRPEFRHQGYGIQLWNTAIQHLQGRNMGLDGVIEQQENYAKSGFKAAYRNLRFQTQGTGLMVTAPDLVALTDIAFSEVLAYDIYPTARPVFLQSWIRQKHGAALGIVANGRLVACGVIRACQDSYRIGPLFADTPGLAGRLFSALLGYAPADCPVFIDMPEPNAEALALAQHHGMPLVFEAARMYTGEVPDLDLGRIYGVTTLELG